MTVGDSRVGKSTVTKLLINLFQTKGKKIKVYDHDNRNKLKAYTNSVPIESLDFFNGGTDKILDEFNKNELDIIIVDMPGQYIDKICQYIACSDLFDLLVAYKWRLTFLQPISHRTDCVSYMKTLVEVAANNANYVVVKNQHFDTRFIEYQQSMQGNLQLVGGTEIVLPALPRDHYEALERTGKPYSMCYTDTSIYIIYRSYIYQWIQNFNNSILSNNVAIKYLGLNNENRTSVTGVF
ncbi:ATP-binding protein [Halotia branconii]|uniref:ATP-binding protein n=1 Tax=Halotia branconii CENA392 TaxID=1539056 RepID=A0AAJ6PCS1_9CYAN|nr:ATP-binding protein [Halotia branconii]WGV29086.1 ATP-binding protein [Halotia branconii CENA392]